MRRRTRLRIRLPRLLQGIAVAVVATLAFSSVSTQQASAIFNSENPSGKTRRDGAWYKLWVNGKTGWLWSPWKLPIAYPAHKSKFVTPKEGNGEVPVYGRAVPNSEEYPDDFVPPAGAIPSPTPLPYTMKQGDRYKILDKHVPTDHYYAWTIDKSMPYDHTVFKGSDDYYLIQFGNRVAFVKKADVDVRR